MALLDAILLWNYYGTPKTQYREVAAAAMARHGGAATVLVLCAGRGKLEYYFRQLGAAPRIDALACHPAELKAVKWDDPPLAGASDLFFVVARRAVDPALIALFRWQFSELECDGFKNAALYRFSRPGAAATGQQPCKDHPSAVGEAPFITWWETVRPDFFR